MKRLFTFLLTGLIAVAVNAQIPNNSFENWTQVGTYWNPDDWGCLNNLTAALNVFTCERGTPGNPGNYYLKVTSKSVMGGAVIPGIAVCGTIDPTTYLPLSGFPFNQRPEKLTGKWQHMIFGNSQGYIEVELTKWNTSNNSRDVIAFAHQQLAGMAMSWANFNIPLAYQSTETPDSCMIVLAASGTNPSNLDYLWVDGLAFSGAVGIDKYPVNQDFLRIFPNPVKDLITAELFSSTPEMGVVTITDITGKQLFTEKRPFLAGKNVISVSATSLNLRKGLYIISVRTNKAELQQRLFIQ